MLPDTALDSPDHKVCCACLLKFTLNFDFLETCSAVRSPCKLRSPWWNSPRLHFFCGMFVKRC